MSVLVGKQAPDFTAQAVMPDNEIREFNLKKESKGKNVVLFSTRWISLSSARRKSLLSTTV